MNFEELGIQQDIVAALKEMNIFEPTEIQEKVIPLIKEGKNVIAMSKTGSGKTLAFGIPLIETTIRGKGITALILVPTRELAVQVSVELQKLSKQKRCVTTAIYGGVSIEPQIHRLRTTDIVVSTPGRLKDHLQRNTINLSRVTTAVLDEADKMVEMGFIEDVELILQHTPQQKQVILLGATLSAEIDHLKRMYMPQSVTARSHAHVHEEYLQQFYYSIQPHEKFSLLVHLLKTEKPARAIIFCSARATVEIVARNLSLQGFKVEGMHGKMGQAKRLQVIDNFHRGYPPLLVASAVAARGLDIKDVTHIFNYDLSKDPQEYIHRVGRTARAGETGKAITLLSPRDYEPFQNILHRYPVKVKEVIPDNFPRIRFDARGSFERPFDRRGPPRRTGFRPRQRHYR